VRDQSRYLVLGALLLVHAGGLRSETPPDVTYEFRTAKYNVEMRVSFPPPYVGKRLVAYRSTKPGEETCLSADTGVPGCIEKFVGAVAEVAFTVTRTSGGQPSGASIREVVTLLDQSPGLPARPPFDMTIKLADGVGSDLQVFGYDETPLAEADREAQRKASRADWRRFRQELYMDKDRRPFAVIEWKHTTARIHLERVETPSSVLVSRR